MNIICIFASQQHISGSTVGTKVFLPPDVISFVFLQLTSHVKRCVEIRLKDLH